MSLSGLVIHANYTAAVKARMHETGTDALKEAADELLRIASETVPVAKVGGGFLRDAGKAEADEAGPSAQVYYDTPPVRSHGRAGGGGLAVIVHEDTTASHSDGRAKWLEMAAKENAARLGVTIGMSIKKKMR